MGGKQQRFFKKQRYFIFYLLATIILTLSLTIASAQTASTGVNHKLPSQYHPSWQRLLLQLSSTYYTVVKEGQVDLDNSLLYASRSLGMSRLPVIAEGIENQKLISDSKWVDNGTPGEGIKTLSQSTGKHRLELLLLLGAYYSFKPDNYRCCKDSVLYYLNQAITESRVYGDQKFERLALCLIGKMYVQANELRKGDVIFNRLLKQCQVAGDLNTEARAWAYRGLYTAYSRASSADRIGYLQKAVKIYHQLGNKEGECNALTNICYINVASYKLDLAYETSKQALGLAELIRFPYTHYNTDAVAMLGTFKGEFGEPLKYTFSSIRTAELTRDTIGLPYFYSRLSALYLMEGDREQEVIAWGLKAANAFIAAKESSYLNLVNLSVALLKLGRPQETISLINRVAKLTPPITPTDKLMYYVALNNYYSSDKIKQYDLAEANLIRADSIETEIEKHGLSFRRGMITFGFGGLYFRKGDYKRAKLFYERYISGPMNIESFSIQLEAIQRLIIIDALTGNQASELKHRRLQSTIIDSAFRISKIRQAEELNVKYETEERQNQLTLLNQKFILEQANLQQANLVRNLTFGGILLALIIAGMLYKQNREKQKNNEIITHKNELLQSLVSEKEWLLKEVHHRVKNNLHTVICLLESQAAYLENDALEAIENSKHRIYAMSLIHQKLYHSDDIKAIDMDVYISELVGYLEDSFDSVDRIRLILDIDAIQLNISHAIPLGLIINEAVTNSIKYAFPDQREGTVWIRLTESMRKITLELSDDGIGMPSNIYQTELDSLGLELMKGLTKDIKGDIKFENNNGTHILINFYQEKLNHSEDVLSLSR
jgi:two-component sensor histidine kinase